MKENSLFDILVLIARPAAGKSEIIDYLNQVPLDERVERFHLGEFEEIDDFRMIWSWFEEDALLEKMGHPRLHSDADGYFTETYFWDLLIERIGLDYEKIVRDHEGDPHPFATIIEFSRGTEHGGYRSAFSHLSQRILQKAAVLYVDVTWEESLRKNRRRFNPRRPDSILEHSLPDAKLERLYKEIDWKAFSQSDPHFLAIRGMKVPYVVFDNADDVTTRRGEALGMRLETGLNELWKLSQNRSRGT